VVDRISRAEARRLGIRSLMSLLFSFALLINKPLKNNDISCLFGTKMALLYNLAAHQGVL
jgi:hypothetical protein